MIRKIMSVPSGIFTSSLVIFLEKHIDIIEKVKIIKIKLATDRSVGHRVMDDEQRVLTGFIKLFL